MTLPNRLGSRFGTTYQDPNQLTGAGKTLAEFGYQQPEEPKESFLSKALNILQTGEYAAGGLMSGKGIIQGIKDKTSPSEVLGVENKFAKFAVDVLMDPTTYVTFGTGSAIKLVTKGGAKVVMNKFGTKAFKKAVQAVGEKSARKSFARVLSSGGEAATKKYLTGGISKGGMKFMGATIPGTPGLGAKIGKPIDKLITKAPVIGPMYKGAKEGGTQLLNAAFRPMKKIDDLATRWGGKTESGIGRYTEQQFSPFAKGTRSEQGALMETIVKVAKKFKGKGEEVRKAVESGTNPDELKMAINMINRGHKGMVKELKALGIDAKEVKNYIRRHPTEKGKEYLKAKGGSPGFPTAGMSGKIGAQKGRKFERIVQETGKDVTWKKQDLILNPIKEDKVLGKLEKVAANKVKVAQRILDRITKADVTKGMKPLRDILAGLKKHISSDPAVINSVEGAVDFSKQEFDDIIKGVTKMEKRKLIPKIKELEELVLSSQGDEFLYSAIKSGKKIPYQKKAIDLQKSIVQIQNDLADQVTKLKFFDYTDDAGNYYKKVLDGKYKGHKPLQIDEINKNMQSKVGGDLFETDAFKAYAGRVSEHVQQVNTHKFITETGTKFGIKGDVPKTFDGVQFVPSNNELLKGTLLPRPIAEHIDSVADFIKGDEASNAFLKGYDKALSFWKKSVTGVFPAFHSRNAVGGMFNNFLAGVKNPNRYKQSVDIWSGKKFDITTDVGYKYNSKDVMNAYDKYVGQQTGMMDVMREVEKEVGMSNTKKVLTGGPQFVMEKVENNLRMPLFLDRVIKGDSFEEAAKKVFKFHFDYAPEGLSKFEKNFMKRLIPFYRWTRGNVPLQIEQMMKQPGKYAGMEKAREAISGKEGEAEFGDLPEWMREQFIMKVGNKEGKSLWLQLDLPLEDIAKLPFNKSGMREMVSMLSPFIKYPIERFTNQNLYFGEEIYNPELPKEMQTSKAMQQLKLLPSPIKKFLNFRETKYRDYSAERNTPGDKKIFKTRYEMDSIKLHLLRSTVGRFYATIGQAFDPEYAGIVGGWLGTRGLRMFGGAPLRMVDIEESKSFQDYAKQGKEQEVLNYLKKHGQIPYAEDKTSGLRSNLR